MADDGKRKGSGNGFQGLGLSDPVYRGIVRMGFRVSHVVFFAVCWVHGAATARKVTHTSDGIMIDVYDLSFQE